MSANRSNSNASGGIASNANTNVGSQVSCAICSESYKQTDQIYAGSCGHVFHWHCLQRWWDESKACAICREEDAEYFQIYLTFEESRLTQNPTASPSGNPGGNVQGTNNNNNDYENMLYEERLYREEIEYLNERIRNLTTIGIEISSSSDSI